MPTYTIDQYADFNGWAGIDALGSSRRAKGVALQREKLRDECTLRDANDEVLVAASALMCLDVMIKRI